MEDEIINVYQWQPLGPYFVAPAEVVARFGDDWQGGPDFQFIDTDAPSGKRYLPVVSIGRVERDQSFHWRGAVLEAKAGMVLASPTADLYQARGVKCLWLR